MVLVAPLLGLLVLVGAAVASFSLMGTSRQRYQEERRKELERFERNLAPDLWEQWEEYRGSGE